MKCSKFVAKIEAFEASYSRYADEKDAICSRILDISAGKLGFRASNAVRL